MKKIVMFTMGTRGDVQPYIFLAQALLKEGHVPVIGSHPCWRSLVESHGIFFAPIGPDIDIEKESSIIRGKTANPIKGMLNTMKFIFRIIENSSPEVMEALKDADLLIESHSHMGAAEAEALHIPSVSVTLQTEMIPETGKKQSLGRKLVNACINPTMTRPYNKIRKKCGLKPIKSMDQMMSPYYNLIPISQYVIERNPYWDQKNRLTGYWYQKETDYVPDHKLQEFLSNGEKPVILALGAMSFENEEEREKFDYFIHAFQKTHMRAVIQGFQKTLENYELPDSMIAVGGIPHSYLFRQGYCVIHHGGFGTSAATLLYGVPSIVIPHVLDQFGVADRLYKLGVSVEPIKASELSENKITEAIKTLRQGYDRYHKTVQNLAAKMEQEDGLKMAVELIEDVLNR